MKETHPPRLKDSPEFGEYLRALENQPLNNARLLQNAAQIEAKLVATAGGGGALLGTQAATKLGIPLAVGVGIVAATLMLTNQGRRPAPPTRAEPVTMPVTLAQPPLPETAPAATALSEDSSTDKKRQKNTKSRAIKAASSSLPAQIALYDAAKEAGQQRKYKNAVTLLDQLLKRYPSTPLRAEAELSRVDYLTRGSQAGRAIPELKRLIRKPAHQGRRGELLRVLGDLLRQKGGCAEASVYYNKATRHPLRGIDKQAVEQGLQECAEN